MSSTSRTRCAPRSPPSRASTPRRSPGRSTAPRSAPPTRPTARARTAAGSPTEFQDRAANTDGAVRYTAPSLLFETSDGRRLEAGGFQPIEAYDVVVANLDPTLTRRPPAEDPVDVLAAFPYPLATAEVAAIMAEHLVPPDVAKTERALLGAVAEGRATSRPAGDGALWSVAG